MSRLADVHQPDRLRMPGRCRDSDHGQSEAGMRGAEP